MNTTKLLSVLLMIAFGIGSFTRAAAQDKKAQEKKKEEDVIRISAELVQVDILVTDKNNKPVSGLKPDDFELFDNDKPQKISFFSYEESKSKRFEDNEQARTLPRVIAPADLKRVVAFVVDTLHIRPDNLYRAKKMLSDFIDTKMEPGDLVLIMPTGGGSGLYAQFTADQRVLHSAVSNLRQTFILDDNTPARRGINTNQAVISLLPALAERRDGMPQAPGQGGTMGSSTSVGDSLEESDVRATLNALNGTITAMSRFPGRKIGVFVSEGIRTFRTQAENILAETAYLAARANVVFYSIDPSGLDPVNFTVTDDQVKAPADLGVDSLNVRSEGGDSSAPTKLDPQLRFGETMGNKRGDFFESQDALIRLANETGGKFYRNNNDIKVGLSDLLEENGAYYLLGFQPEQGKWDGKFHKLRVAVRARPDLTVSTRKGYVAKTEKPRETQLNPKAAEILEAISSPLVRRDIDINLTPFYKDDTHREPFMTTLIHIDASKLNFKDVGGAHKDKVTVTGILSGANGRAVDSFSNTLELSFEPKDYEGVRKDGLLVTRGTNIKPGAYQFRVLVKEADTGQIGTATSYIEVPELKGDQLALSSIFTDAQLLQQNKASDSAGGATSMSQRRFPRSGQFAYITIIYNAKPAEKSNQPQLEMVTRILRDGQVLFSGKPKPVDVLEGSMLPFRIITGGIMQLSTLKPDEYTLEVTVVDKLRKNSRARQEITFTVE